MNDFLLYLGIPLGAIILTYIFARWINGNAILTSKPVDTTAGVNADQYYYLPSYVLTLRATARIAVHKTTDDLITDAQLSAMTFDFETKIEPDTSQLIVLNYKGDWFSNDELKIETTGESLLQNISVKTEDRFPQIVSIFTNAPKELIKSLHESGQQTAQPTPLAVKIEFVETTKTFVITPDEITTGNIKKEWSIQLNGDFTGTPTPVDAGFTLKSPKRAPAIAGNTYKGILSRPMTRQKWDVEVNNQVEPYSFSCTVPDIASVLVTPVRRSLFTKRQQIPRFSNGVLTENFIDKSSEWEAFASIPVNIGKALVSIPAQLLQFKIIRIKQDTEYEKAVGALIKAKEENAKLALEKVNTELKAALDALAKAKAQTQQTQPEQQVPDVPPLGKLCASRSCSYDTLIDENSVAVGTTIQTLPMTLK